MQTVNVPGVGPLNFPDGMSQQDMAAAIYKNFPQLVPPGGIPSGSGKGAPASFTFTSPEGKSYTVTGPAGATQEQAFAILQQQLSAQPPQGGIPGGSANGSTAQQQTTMDVRLPDGSILSNVPAGTTKAQIVAKLRANGRTVPQEWLTSQPDAAATATQDGSDPAAPSSGVARTVGLGERALMRGVGNLVGIPFQLGQLADRAGASAHDYLRSVFGLKPNAEPGVTAPNPADAMDKLADLMHLPSPDTSRERIASAAVSGLPAALVAPEAPLAGALSGAAGGAGSQIAAEHGAGPVGQAVAGIAAGGLPAIGAGGAAAIRGAVRGSDAAGMAARVADSAGPLTVGQASGGHVLQVVESSLARLPGGGAIREAISNQNTALGNRVADVIDNLAAGQDASPTGTGKALTAQLEKAANQMKGAAGQAFDAIDQQIPDSTGIAIPRTLATLERLTAVPQGAQATGALLVSPKIAAIRNAVLEDLQANGPQQTPESVSTVLGADGRPVPLAPAGTTPGAMPNKLDMGTLRDLKTLLGGQIEWGPFSTDTANGGMKQVYSALRQDINDGASLLSQKLAADIRSANAAYTVQKAKQDVLESVISKAGGPEQVFSSLMSGARNGATTLRTVLDQLDFPNKQLLAAAALKRMGLANPGAQGAAGDAFSAESFLTKWNQLSPEARDALFSALPGDYAKNVTKLAQNAELMRRYGKVLANSSNTAAAWHYAGMAGALMTSLLGGEFHIAAGIAGTAAGNLLLSKALTNPATVRWLAKETDMTRALKASLPGAIAGSQQQPAGQSRRQPVTTFP